MLYDPANPANALVEGILSGGCLNVFFVIFGAVFVVIAAAIAVVGLLLHRALSP